MMEALSLVVPLQTQEHLPLLIKSLGSVGKAWNMMALGPLFYVWWSKTYFAFKYLRTTPHEAGLDVRNIQLQFRWMPQSPPLNSLRLIKFERGMGTCCRCCDWKS
ncbi:hypothetical protein B0J13DRAFT_544861 [Dactylonectria estremocensis]|uniref:Uncharacterized protein n=1 Tax=Dactylonectria estremocensis TaxID=1079267 RepID=A0A9P9F7P7_9HYPO|nr:hypothetical protein B0J13DRAFT_544861 [Dactylonectria estremocensis]